MLETNDRALKEWAVLCNALRDGQQMLLLRKGGISESDGVFNVSDNEFFLLPTYEHQNRALLKPEYQNRLADMPNNTPATVVIDAYAVVDRVQKVADEEAVFKLNSEYVLNNEYVRQRFDINPYDPLYAITLRAYKLSVPVCVPMKPAYSGCKSWVTMEERLQVCVGSPAMCETEFNSRSKHILETLNG